MAVKPLTLNPPEGMAAKRRKEHKKMKMPMHWDCWNTHPIGEPIELLPGNSPASFCASLRLSPLPLLGYPVRRATRSELALIVTVPLLLLLPA